MDKRVIFFIFLLSVINVWAIPRTAHLMNKREFFCGSKLRTAMALVCKGKYHSPEEKKSVNNLFYDEYEDIIRTNSEDDNQIDFPFLQRETTNSLVPNGFRWSKRGITEECCNKPCTYKVLSLYCA